MSTSKNGRMNRYLLASDFDRTLSFNDSGRVLADLRGIDGFDAKIAELAKENFVQQGAELTYLLLHDPDFRGIRREDLHEAGKGAKLKENVELLPELLNRVSAEHEFVFCVISAAPREVVESALEGIVSPDRIFGTEFEYDDDGGIVDVKHATAGYGKVAVLDALREEWNIGRERIVYYIRPVARRIVLGDDAVAVAVPILEEVFGWDRGQIRSFLEGAGLVVREWEKLQTDTVILRPAEPVVGEAAAAGRNADG